MTTVSKLIELLQSYPSDAVITNEQLEDFKHIRTISNDDDTVGVILSTTAPIGYCNRTGEKVYQSRINGYDAFSPELNEDLYTSEFKPMEKYKIVFTDGETEYYNDLKEAKQDLEDDAMLYCFSNITKDYEKFEDYE